MTDKFEIPTAILGFFDHAEPQKPYRAIATTTDNQSFY